VTPLVPNAAGVRFAPAASFDTLARMSSRKKKARRARRRQQPAASEHARPRKPSLKTASPAYPEIEGKWCAHLAVVVALVAATTWLYAGTLDLGFFHWDDPTYVPENPWIQGVTLENIAYILSTPYFANYSPMHLFSYILDHAAGGLDPRVYHLSSNLWGGLAAGGVYLVGLALFGRPVPALAAGALFAAHPSHVEAIAWISSRKDLVAAAFTLPAMAAYVRYRRGERHGTGWYLLSVGLFVLGVAGKLSVVVVPGILFLFDWFVERRRDVYMLLDKVPYGVVCLFIALRVMDAQPPTRNPFEFYVFGHSTLKNLWLLTGLGDYVLARGRPDAGMGAVSRMAYAAVAVGVFLLPALWWKRMPGRAVALVYWVLLALVPSQVLSFVHPVADRYLFFPSAGFVLLLCWWGGRVSERGGRRMRLGVGAAAILLAGFWTRSTLAYIDEWRDPRSVWHAALEKTDDVAVHQYLGTHYQDQADRLPTLLRGDAVQRAEARALAEAVWGEDGRLAPLLEEWVSDPASPGPRTEAFQHYLRQLAMEQYDQALRLKGSRVLPNLFFRRGKIALETGRFGLAEREFKRAYEEAQRHTSPRVQQELAVRSHHALGLVYWRQRRYAEALEWVRLAEAAQQRFGGHWVPNIQEHRRQLERLVGR